MKVFSDVDLNQLYIEGVSSGPVADYVVSQNGEFISIGRVSLGMYELKDVHFSTIEDGDGLSFTTPEATAAYIRNLLIKRFPIRFEAEYPLILDRETSTLSIDEEPITDGGNF